MARFISFLAVALLAPVAFLHAQQQKLPAPSSGSSSWGSIDGVVVDSLHERALNGALVAVIQRPEENATSSPSGTFRIDSIPPGTYTLEIQHALLDSLGIQLISDSIKVTAGNVQHVTLRVPPAKAFITSVCPEAKRRFGPAVLVGRVIDAENESPLAGATVSLAWTEVELRTGSGPGLIQRTPRIRTATTSADGSYRICGIPETLTGTIQATHGDVKTAEIHVESSDAPISMRMFRLQTSPSQVGRVTGVVTNRGGVVLADARISVQGDSNVMATTRNDGTFLLDKVALGTQVLLVRRVGYAPELLPLEIIPDDQNKVTVRLDAVAPRLTPVDVNANAKIATALAHTGYDDRKKLGFGKFITAADLEKWQSTTTTDALRHLPGIRIADVDGKETVQSSRGGTCVSYLIDRMPSSSSSGPGLNDMVKPSDIAAMEFYQVGSVPNELMIGPDRGCGLLVIWTRGQLKPPKDSTQK